MLNPHRLITTNSRTGANNGTRYASGVAMVLKTGFIDNGEPFLVEYNQQQSREGFSTEQEARKRYSELCGPAYHDISVRILKRQGGNWIDITTPKFLEYTTRKPTVQGGLCEW